MIPAVYKIKDHYKGDTFNGVEFTLMNSESNTPVDLTGSLIKIQFRKDNPKGIKVKELNIGTGITVTDPPNGVFKIDAFLLDWDVATYYYDAQVTSVEDVVRTYIKGTLTTIQDTTNG